ncbi:MAG: glycosyltransferase [Bacteroidetes bacterium]|nr:glycosyltransferase [Bacteroidota bacterium]
MGTSNNNNFVSVIMPAYNASAFISEAIKSILNQTYSNFEFIIINDGSTDSTEKIIRQYNDSRIVYIKNESNLGLIESLNKGISIAKGVFIARMDADDISLPARLLKQVEALEFNSGLVAVGSDYFQLVNNRRRLIQNDNDSDYQKAMLLFTPCFCHPVVMMRNVFTEKNLKYKSEYKYAEDYKLWTELAHIGKFANINEPLLEYRAHSGQVSTENHQKQLEISERIRREFYESLGLQFTPKEFKSLNLIGNNVFIRKEEELLDISNVLMKIRNQNNVLEIFNDSSLDKLLYKFWLDSCGNASLGLKAWRIYKSSELSAICDTGQVQKVKLLAKCLIRSFR